MKKFVGYHGTKDEAAQKIFESKSFRPSIGEEEWLGKGVYFFEEDYKQAINFCTKLGVILRGRFYRQL